MNNISLKIAPPRVFAKTTSAQGLGFNNETRKFLLKSGRSATRKRRYFFTFGLPFVLIWSAVFTYTKFTPKSYTSEMTLNLPGSVSNSSFSLDQIGQTSTSSGSPFNSVSMSPKVIYKSIAESSRVLGLAAKVLKDPSGTIPKPTIQLIEETALMNFAMTGPSPEIAQARAQALLVATEQQLDILRKDEIERRSDSIRQSLVEVETNLKNARLALLNFQQKVGMVSIDQFRNIIDNSATLRQKIGQLRAEVEKAKFQNKSYSEILGITTGDAATALQVQADPRYSALSNELSLALTEDGANRAKWGANHPKRMESATRVRAARNQIIAIATVLTGKGGKRVIEHLLLSESKDRSDLFRTMVETEAQITGLNAQLGSLELAARAQDVTLDIQTANAAKLEDLERDHKIAEAVFSSALARVDTNRQDIYASYPLLQVVSPATLPKNPSSPKVFYAIGGGLAGTFFLFIALVLTWIRQPILRKILKSA